MKSKFLIPLLIVIVSGSLFQTALAEPTTQASSTKTQEETSIAKEDDKKEEVKPDIATTSATTTKAVTKKTVKKSAIEDRKTCEILNDLDVNIDVLASTSESAQIKLKDIKSTLDEEIAKRDSFVTSLKSLLSFKKSEVSIMTEAKSDVENAQEFYKDLDDKVDTEKKFVDLAKCEKVVRKELLVRYNSVESLTKSEDLFRKDLAKKLKKTMKLLVKDVEKKEDNSETK